MTKLHIINAVMYDDRFKRSEKLDVQKFLQDVNGAEFYRDMSPEMLHNIYAITGTPNGMVIISERIRFLITSRITAMDGPVVSFNMDFDKGSGVYLGVTHLYYTPDLEIYADDNPAFFPDAELIFSQIETYTDLVMSKARGIGYIH